MSDQRARQAIRESRDPEEIVALLLRAQIPCADAGELLMLDNPTQLGAVCAALNNARAAVEQRGIEAITADWQRAVAEGRGCEQCHGTGRVVVWDTLDSLTGDYAEWGPCPEAEASPAAHNGYAHAVNALWYGHGSRGSGRPDPTAYMNSIGRCFRVEAAHNGPSAWLTIEEQEVWASYRDLYMGLQPWVEKLSHLQKIEVGRTVEISNPRARVKDALKRPVPHGSRGQVERIDRDTKRVRLALADGRAAWTSAENLTVVDVPRAVLASDRQAEQAKARHMEREAAARALAPARGSRVTLEDGAKGKVFWSGIGKGGKPTMGVRVPGEPEARWVELEEKA